MWLRLLLFLLGCALFGLLLYWQRSEDEVVNYGQNVLVFALVNLNIAILCVLLFLIGRNVVKLVFDWRRNILGSKLRTRLMLTFVGLTLIPSTFVFIMASGFLNRAVEGWFNTQVENSVTAAVEIAQQYFESLRESVASSSSSVAKDLRSHPEVLRNREGLEKYLEDLRKGTGLYAIHLLEEGRTPIAEVHNAAAFIDAFKEPPLGREAIGKALRNEESVLLEEKGANRFLRGYMRFIVEGKVYVLVVTQRVRSELSSAISTVTDSYREYNQMKLFKSPLMSGYTLTLAMITALVIFGAIWIAFFIARQIVVPIQRLAEGTRAIARGNYDFQIRKTGDDEFGFLVGSFNTMVADLKASRAEAERRRLFIETILSNLAVGVIGIDSNKKITSMNNVAARLFDVPDAEQAMGKPLQAILEPEVYEHLSPLLEGTPDESSVPEVELHMASKEREHRILCTSGNIVNPQKQFMGVLLLFDDITDLAKAQAMSAWREVARRIAHEIKNPLTPIQLSAQRLHKLLGDLSERKDLIDSADTIVENVEAITRLANEFSKFARMPTAEFKPGNLNRIVSDAVSMFAVNEGDIIFQFIADNKMPEIMLDIGQIKSVLVNLIDNAIAAIHTEVRPEGVEKAKVVIRTCYNRKERMAEVEVADNGPGIPPDDHFRIFEPYFTTKKGGTGLGLAIVNTILSDHQGDIKVYDNVPRGAKFIFEIPAARKHVTQRRLVEPVG